MSHRTQLRAGTRKLERSLSLWQVSLAGIGTVLGAGVYALIGPASGQAGNVLWLAFLLAGVAAGFTAYSYARLGRMSPKDSPEFQYTSLAFGPRIGFVAGWIMLAADLLAAAAVALGFAGYFAHLAGTPVVLNALFLLLVVAVVIYVGVGESVGLAIVLTIIEAAGLIFIIIIGIPSWTGADFSEAPKGVSGLWGAAALIFFAYLGFDELGNFAEEMRDPERNLPRALVITMLVSTAIYILVALSATAVAGWEALSSSQAPLAIVAGRVLGSRADFILSLMALAATGNTVLLLLAAASRSVYGMASSGAFPSSLAQISRTQIPVKAAAVVLGIAAALVLLRDLTTLAELTNGAILVSFMLVNMSLLWLAIGRRSSQQTGVRLADLSLPLVALGMCGWLLLHTGWLSMLVAAVLSVVGFLVAARLGTLGNADPNRLGAEQ